MNFDCGFFDTMINTYLYYILVIAWINKIKSEIYRISFFKTSIKFKVRSDTYHDHYHDTYLNNYTLIIIFIFIELIGALELNNSGDSGSGKRI